MTLRVEWGEEGKGRGVGSAVAPARSPAVSVRAPMREASRRTLGWERCLAAVQAARSERASAWCAAEPKRKGDVKLYSIDWNTR